MDYSIKTIKTDIVNLSEKDFMMKYLLKSSNWYFSEYQSLEIQQAIEQMEGLKSILNSKIGVAFHNVLMVGSGKIGCSLSPFKNFKPFDEKSDIDIAIISLKLFYEIWEKIRLASMNEYIPYYNDITSSVFRGFINEKHFTNIDLARQHWGNATEGLNRCISEEIKIYHPINYRIYRSWEDLEEYHLKGINLLKKQVYGNNL